MSYPVSLTSAVELVLQDSSANYQKFLGSKDAGRCYFDSRQVESISRRKT